MERIIISEVDNTYNIESLSSYDVVYVPGFGLQSESPNYHQATTTEGARQTYFRNPILVTTKYEFLQKFGGSSSSTVATCPVFPKDQPYPVATTEKIGFPNYAIPNFVEAKDPIEVENVANFSSTDTTLTDKQIIDAVCGNITGVTSYYDYIFGNDHTDYVIGTEHPWTPESEATTYYELHITRPAEGTTGPITAKMFALDRTQASYNGRIVFTMKSSVSPSANGWKIKVGDVYYYTDDSDIEFDTTITTNPKPVKSYYKDEVVPSMMFNAGDVDNGYRYALYLLSLGIPVYYEQMNAMITPIDMTDPMVLETGVNPKANEWYELVGGDTYVLTADTVVPKDETGKATKQYYNGADISIDSMYRGLEARFGSLGDDTKKDYSFDNMGDYSVKYITTGGYPVFEYGTLKNGYGTSGLAVSMINLASTRQDAIALIDHTNNPNRSIYETDDYSVVHRVRNSTEIIGLSTNVGSFGAMFTPWYECTNTMITGGTGSTYAKQNQMPASLGFLTALAQQLKNYNPWLAVSGVSRGPVPYCSGLHTNFVLTNNVADSYQTVPDSVSIAESISVSINPITYIRNVGYCIWGNRTLRNNKNGTQATSFLNIRNVVSDIKKALYEASQKLLFEQNSDILWINFKSLVTPLLDTMVADYILDDYNITKYNVDPDTGLEVPAYKVLATIKIKPVSSVEVFELKVQLENSEITVTEE